MTDYICNNLIENYYDERKHKNNKKWYENYIHVACKNFARFQDEDEVDEIANQYREEAINYVKYKYDFDSIYNHSLSNEDIYTAMLEKWIIKYHKNELENPIKNI